MSKTFVDSLLASREAVTSCNVTSRAPILTLPVLLALVRTHYSFLFVVEYFDINTNLFSVTRNASWDCERLCQPITVERAMHHGIVEHRGQYYCATSGFQ